MEGTLRLGFTNGEDAAGDSVGKVLDRRGVERREDSRTKTVPIVACIVVVVKIVHCNKGKKGKKSKKKRDVRFL